MDKLVYVVPDVAKCKIGADYNSATWYMIPEENKKYVTAISKGSDVEFQFKEEDGKKVLTFIKAIGGSGNESKASVKPQISKPTQNTTPSNKPTCEDCGAELKDATYPTCYECSMARREKEAKSPESSDRQRSIEVQAMVKAAANVVGASIAGQVDFSNPEQAEKLANYVSTVAKGLLKEFDNLKK